MDLNAARDLAYELLDKYVHVGTYACGVWSVRWTNSRNKAGECDYETRTIGLSQYWTRNRNRAEVEITIRHEIAHVLTPEWCEEHGDAWAGHCATLGIEAKATCERPIANYKWLATCETCGGQDGLFRLGKRAANGGYCCTACSHAEPWRPNTDFRLIYVQQF
jgi:predicted SprT family Zn-dependent metalloprotease